MPIPGGARYRVKTTASGKKVRLAFQGDQVVEAKNLATGDTHTPAEFAADARARKTKRHPAVHSFLRGAGMKSW